MSRLERLPRVRKEAENSSPENGARRVAAHAPDIVNAILDGKQGPEVALARFLETFPVQWENQRQALSRPS